ncbi:MAG: PD-(D/E)XK nuclease family protein, partial [Vicinamibacteria bacterium]
ALDAPDESDTVAIGEFESDMDRDAAIRDREETKRLVYVATTRARDRLYLATTLTREGRFRPAKGSLGEVLPPSIVPAFEVAASLEPGEAIDWQGPAGRHSLRVAGRAAVAPPSRAEADVVRGDDFDVMAATEAGRRRAVTAEAADVATRLPSPAARGGGDVLAGVLVNRALAAGVAFEIVADDARLMATLDALVADTDRSPVDDHDAALARAATALRRLADDAELRALVETGRRAHEVPVSLEVDGRILRGVIDCLVQAPDGRVHVVEFTTGAPDEAHARQLALYVEAARAVFPGVPVSGRLAYL